jgi:hypothetical protein
MGRVAGNHGLLFLTAFMQSKLPQGRITRANFEREIHLIVEQVHQGRLKFSKASMLDSLKAIRLAPNRRINLNTIGSSIRATANMTTSLAERDEQDFTEPPTP